MEKGGIRLPKDMSEMNAVIRSVEAIGMKVILFFF